MPSPKPTYDYDLVMQMLARPNGATSDEVAAAVGRPKHLVSNRLSKWKIEGKAFHSGSTAGGRPYFATKAQCDAWMAANPHVEHADAIADALTKAGGTGMMSLQIAEATGIESKTVASVANRLAARNSIQIRAYKGWRLYWAPDVDVTFEAEMALRRRIDQVTKERSRVGGGARWKNPKPARKACQAPVTITNPDAGKPQGEVDFSRARKTVCPSVSYDARFQLPPGSTPFGAGFAAVGLGRSVETGRAWA